MATIMRRLEIPAFLKRRETIPDDMFQPMLPPSANDVALALSPEMELDVTTREITGMPHDRDGWIRNNLMPDCEPVQAIEMRGAILHFANTPATETHRQNMQAWVDALTEKEREIRQTMKQLKRELSDTRHALHGYQAGLKVLNGEK